MSILQSLMLKICYHHYSRFNKTKIDFLVIFQRKISEKKKRYFAEKIVTDSKVASSKHATIFAQTLIMKNKLYYCYK